MNSRTSCSISKSRRGRLRKPRPQRMTGPRPTPAVRGNKTVTPAGVAAVRNDRIASLTCRSRSSLFAALHVGRMGFSKQGVHQLRRNRRVHSGRSGRQVIASDRVLCGASLVRPRGQRRAEPSPHLVGRSSSRSRASSSPSPRREPSSRMLSAADLLAADPQTIMDSGFSARKVETCERSHRGSVTDASARTPSRP